ncbi:hypothetical protein [Carboxylicivirga linearis]|uniref:Uncharacterized protein n=1 Tax=Carboxylicivirga linearis TaxID=1628157 RepID=A0ABS5JU39_9BACT|nr:hypothetical protein [Carboxylicivirga linearis]MBS2098352.1 hypothetical protein [Carboxylicivirga linearis]
MDKEKQTFSTNFSEDFYIRKEIEFFMNFYDDLSYLNNDNKIGFAIGSSPESRSEEYTSDEQDSEIMLE